MGALRLGFDLYADAESFSSFFKSILINFPRAFKILALAIFYQETFVKKLIKDCIFFATCIGLLLFLCMTF